MNVRLAGARMAREQASTRMAALIEAGTAGVHEADEGIGWTLASHVDAVIDCLTDHVIATLDADGNVTGWNRAAQATTGYRRADIVGRNFEVFYTPADRRQGVPLRDLKAAARDGIHRSDGWRLRRDGDAFRARTVLQLSVNPDGQGRGFVMVARDVGEHRELLGLRDERDRARKLEVLGRLAGPMAGEMIGVLDEIGAGAGSAVAARGLDVRTRRLLQQAQAFARRQTGCPQASDVQEMIGAIDGLIACAAGEGIELDWRLDAAGLSVTVDPARFQTTLLDMVGTARAALPHGGRLRVFAEAATDGGAGGAARVAVGVGMGGAGTLQLLAPPMPGLVPGLDDAGAGLRAARSKWEQVARLAGGSLVLENRDDGDMIITMQLPAAAPAAAGASDGGRAARTVLLVDDDANVVSLVGEMLTYLGHSVVPAHDAEEAMQRLQADRSITCLFSDVVMPNGMNGVQLVQAARAVRPGLRTALASARRREELATFGDMPGDVAFFAKPYALAEINAYLKAA